MFKRVVTNVRIQANADVILFTTVSLQDSSHLTAEIAFHFKNNAGQFLLGVISLVSEELVHGRQDQATRLPGADSSQSGNPRVESFLWDAQPLRV